MLSPNSRDEVRAGSIALLDIKQPPEMVASFEEPLTADYVPELLQTAHAALRAFLHQKAIGAGYKTSSATLEPFSDRAKKEIGPLMKKAGSPGSAATITVREAKRGSERGYIVSLPLEHNVSLFGGQSTLFDATRPWEDNEGQNEHFYKNTALRKFFVSLFGREAAAIAGEPRKAFETAIHDKSLLQDSPMFNLKACTGGVTELHGALGMHFMGFRFVSPPVTTSHRYPGPVKEGVKREAMPRPDEVTDPIDLTCFVLTGRRFSIFFDLWLPESYARYMTQTAEGGKLSLAHLNMWFVLWYMSDIGEVNNVSSVYAVTSLSQVREANRNERDWRDQVVGPHNLSISKDAWPQYVPAMDKVNEYEAEFEAFGTHEPGAYSLKYAGRLSDNEYTFDETREQKVANKRNLPAQRLIYTDFVNFKLAYSDANGLAQVENIEDWQALSDTDAALILKRALFVDRTWNSKFLSELAYVFTHRIGEYGINRKELFDKHVKRFEDVGYSAWQIDNLRSAAVDGNLGVYLDQLGGALDFFFRKVRAGEVDGPQYASQILVADLFKNEVPGLAWIGETIRELYKRVETFNEEQLQKYITHRSVPNALTELGLITTLAVYGPDIEQVVARDKAKRAPYLETKSDPNHKPAPMAYVQKKEVDAKGNVIDPGRFVMPHQLKVDNLLANNTPQFVILAADAGGGKTIMVLRDAMDRLQSGKSKRPLIVMPANLIRNYIGDATYFFGGGVNMVPLTQSSKEMHDLEGLKKIADAAPINSIFLTSYDFVKGGASSAYYGTQTIEYGANLEFLRNLGFDAVYFDESHFLRNDSQVTRMTRRLAYSIPYRVLATGTLVNNQLSDVANQVSIFIPSLFGNKNDFKEQYAEQMSGDRVLKWKPGAEAALRRKISEHALVIQCKRKEWAALLPNRVEDIHLIDPLDPRELANHPELEFWYSCYQALLLKTLEAIKKDAALMAKLKSGDDDDDDDSGDDEENTGSLEHLLKPYLQRLERFLSAPGSDDFGKEVLQGKTAIGPKVWKTAEIIKRHLAKNVPGKILVFTSYHASADAIYEGLPPEIKARALRYRAEQSEEHLARFERDDNIVVMIGTEGTLNTGHNLQMASRLIRIESPWTPGNLEQSIARVYRPDPKNAMAVKRNNIYLDWVIVDHTIDITKMSRLISKILSKVQFDEADNPAYSQLEPLDVLTMSLETITEANSYHGTLRDYANSYSQYLQILAQDLEDYRNDPANKLVYTEIQRKEDGIVGQGIMDHAPYNPDQTLPRSLMGKYNLVRMSDYASEHGDKGGNLAVFNAKGLAVHCEYGEGFITKSNKTNVYVSLRDGREVRIAKKGAVMVFADGKLPPVELRKELATIEEQPLVPVLDKPKAAKSGKGKPVLTPQPEPTPEPKKKLKTVDTLPTVKPTVKPAAEPTSLVELPTEGKELALELYSIYDMLALDLHDMSGLKKSDLPKLEALGFKNGGRYVSIEVPNLRIFDALLKKMQELYTIKPQYMETLNALRATFATGKNKLFTAHKALEVDMKNFWRMQSKPAGKTEIRPYPIIWDETLYIAVRLQGQPAAATLRAKCKVPGATWELTDYDYMLFCTDKEDVVRKLAKVTKAGYSIKKPRLLQKSLDAARVLQRKST